MKKAFILTYGALTYALFLATFLFLIAFLSGLGMPRSVDRGPDTPPGTALVIDVLLVLLFVVQHTVMARPAFKESWQRVVPNPIERSTFVLVTSLVLLFTFWQWRPIPIVVWTAPAPWIEAAVWGLFAGGLLLTLLSTFLIDHFALFGLRQTVEYVRGRPGEGRPLKVAALYRFVRHPLYLGFLVVLWAAPVMTAGHLLYAGLLTLYLVALGIPLEERELVRAHGPAYEEYRSEIPMLIPRPGRHRPS